MVSLLLILQYIIHLATCGQIYGIAGVFEPYPPGYNSLLSFDIKTGKSSVVIPSMSVTMLTNPDLACYDSKHNYYYYLYSNDTATVPVGIWIYDLNTNSSIIPSINLSNYVMGFIGIPVGATNVILCDNNNHYIYILGVSLTNNTNQLLYRIDTDNDFKIELVTTYESMNDEKYKINFYNPGIHIFDSKRNRIWFTLEQSKEGYRNIYSYFNIDLKGNNNGMIINTVKPNYRQSVIAYYYPDKDVIIGFNVTEDHSLDLLYFDAVTLEEKNNNISPILKGEVCFLQFEGTMDYINGIWYGQVFTFPNNNTNEPCDAGYLVGIDVNTGDIVENVEMCDLGPGIGDCVTNMLYL